jgi:hypothetical protein
MKSLPTITALITFALCAATAVHDRPLAAQQSRDQMPIFEYDPTWPKMPLPNDWALGNVTGVDIDDDENVWIIQRPHTILHNYEDGLEHNPPTAICCRLAPPVIKFDKSGKVLASWGGPNEAGGYTWPEHAPADMHAPNPQGGLAASWNGEHTIYVDHKKNVWVGNNAGRGSDAHILKFTQDGKYLLTVGKVGKGQGSNDTTALGKPTGVAVWPATNEVFVADGYTNKRVIVFDADTGVYKRHWGAYGNKPDDAARERYVPGGPPPKQFNTPHGLGSTAPSSRRCSSRRTRRRGRPSTCRSPPTRNSGSSTCWTAAATRCGSCAGPI